MNNTRHPVNWKYTLRGKALDLTRPVVMGILNVTPDSFSDGGCYLDAENALRRTETMVRQGAEIIDVGGESTRPGSDPVSVKEEKDRVIPVLSAVIRQFPDTFFSIDTTKYEVAREALDLGVHMVNDVSGLQKEPRLAGLCSEHDAALIIMHSQGDPKTMQHNPQYANVTEDVSGFFGQRIRLARKAGCEQLILDPGIGFGKDLEHNIALLANFDEFHVHGLPLMIGASRKSFIGRILNDRPVGERLAGTQAVHYEALIKGCRILRVHDVREANDTILVYNALNN